jgi:hypothetical protein
MKMQGADKAHLVSNLSKKETTYDHSTPDFGSFGSENIHADDTIPDTEGENPPNRGCWKLRQKCLRFCKYASAEVCPSSHSELFIFAVMAIDTCIGALTLYAIFASSTPDPLRECGTSLVWYMSSRVLICILDFVQISALFLGTFRSGLDKWIFAWIFYQLVKTVSCMAAGLTLGFTTLLKQGCTQALSRNSVTNTPLLIEMDFIFVAMDSLCMFVIIFAIIWSATIVRMMRV